MTVEVFVDALQTVAIVAAVLWVNSIGDRVQKFETYARVALGFYAHRMNEVAEQIRETTEWLGDRGEDDEVQTEKERG